MQDCSAVKLSRFMLRPAEFELSSIVRSKLLPNPLEFPISLNGNSRSPTHYRLTVRKIIVDPHSVGSAGNI